MWTTALTCAVVVEFARALPVGVHSARRRGCLRSLITTRDGIREIICQVPMHGDQLFEERARNVQWTFRVENSAFERLEGMTTEFADWHAKVTLYKACEAYMTYLYCLLCIKLLIFHSC